MDWPLIAIIFPVGYFLLRILESILLNVVGNILTDPVKNWLANKSLSSKRKRIDQLQKEFDTITKLYEDKNKFYLYVIYNGLYLLGFTAVTIIFSIISVAQEPFLAMVFGFCCVTFFTISAGIWDSMTASIRRIAKYNSYKMQVEKRILELSNKQSVTNKAS